MYLGLILTVSNGVKGIGELNLRVLPQVSESGNECRTIGNGELEACPGRSHVMRCEVIGEP